MALKKGRKKQSPDIVTLDLLRKILTILLFQLGAPQATIAKRVGLSINVVNALLKGIKKNG